MIDQISRHLMWAKLPFRQTRTISINYTIVDPTTTFDETCDGWYELAVANRQDDAYRSLIKQMYAGKPRQDFLNIAQAIRRAELANPSILEVGCGSGYYCEILAHLLQQPVRYVGLDYSKPMVRLASKYYPSSIFLAGDATALPFADESFDIVINGGALMHIRSYERAIVECRRVARQWCIFHTTPVLDHHETTFLQKDAYGEMSIEILFNKDELYSLFEQNELVIHHIMEGIPYNLYAVLGEPKTSTTYLCKVKS
jgi:ubiquinone/menaquinone biosynthesis C-methylase UbiE